jgi:hypothetical protein
MSLKEANKKLEQVITKRLHEYEDYLEGKINTMRLSCGACCAARQVVIASGIEDTIGNACLCSVCPFECESEYRQEFLTLVFVRDAPSGFRIRPPKALARARYKELLKCLKLRGWEYK